jgi:uncharacterized membrane protein required for colicin V production
MPALRSRSRRVAALFGAGALIVGRFWIEAIADRAISTRWPFLLLLLGGLFGIGAAVVAILFTLTSAARTSMAHAVRWGAAAAMLLSVTYLGSRTTPVQNPYVLVTILLAACLCAWKAERSGRAAATMVHRDV